MSKNGEFSQKFSKTYPKLVKTDSNWTKILVLNQLFETNPDLKLSALFMEIFMWSYNDKQGMISNQWLNKMTHKYET